jgi:hypothetical protein
MELIENDDFFFFPFFTVLWLWWFVKVVASVPWPPTFVIEILRRVRNCWYDLEVFCKVTLQIFEVKVISQIHLQVAKKRKIISKSIFYFSKNHFPFTLAKKIHTSKFYKTGSSLHIPTSYAFLTTSSGWWKYHLP